MIDWCNYTNWYTMQELQEVQNGVVVKYWSQHSGYIQATNINLSKIYSLQM